MHSRSHGGYRADAEEQDARGGSSPSGYRPFRRLVMRADGLLEGERESVGESLEGERAESQICS